MPACHWSIRRTMRSVLGRRAELHEAPTRSSRIRPPDRRRDRADRSPEAEGNRISRGTRSRDRLVRFDVPLQWHLGRQLLTSPGLRCSSGRSIRAGPPARSGLPRGKSGRHGQHQVPTTTTDVVGSGSGRLSPRAPPGGRVHRFASRILVVRPVRIFHGRVRRGSRRSGPGTSGTVRRPPLATRRTRSRWQACST